jgi:transposase InsO family protein
VNPQLRGYQTQQIVDCLAREQKVRMSRRKVQRIMRKFGIVCERKRRRPRGPIGQDGSPRLRPTSCAAVWHKVSTFIVFDFRR